MAVKERWPKRLYVTIERYANGETDLVASEEPPRSAATEACAEYVLNVIGEVKVKREFRAQTTGQRGRR